MRANGLLRSRVMDKRIAPTPEARCGDVIRSLWLDSDISNDDVLRGEAACL